MTNHAVSLTALAPRQRGSALIVGLIFLLILTIMGVTSMRSTTMQERMAGNLRDRNIAFQSAEAALREGENFLEQAALPPFGGVGGLLPRQPFGGRAAFWNDTHNWNDNSRMADPVAGAASAPLFVIEELPPIPSPGDSARFGPLPEVGVYRVTARAEGGTTDAVVILQTTYRR